MAETARMALPHLVGERFRLLQIERGLSLDHWSRECPVVEGIGLCVPHTGQHGEKTAEKAIKWAARLNAGQP